MASPLSLWPRFLLTVPTLLSSFTETQCSSSRGSISAPVNIDMLQVWKASGDAILAKSMEELSDVRALKRQLQRLCGVPRFQQRLLHGGVILDEDTRLDSPIDVELVLVPFCSASLEEVIQLNTAAARGWASQALGGSGELSS